MRPDLLILGQGLAGTMLAAELERAGISFAIVDAGHANAATPVAAGIVNPVTGRRIVKSWRIETLLPAARQAYRALEAQLEVPLWREMRVRRSFADARERDAALAKHARGELAPYVETVDESGFWIREAARVDLSRLLQAARAHWTAAGVLRAERITLADAVGRHAVVIDCRGRAAATDGTFPFVPWEFSKGELIELAVEGLDPDVILNRRHWVLPVAAGRAWVGATHEPGVMEATPSEAALVSLTTRARELLGAERTFTVVGRRAGVRVQLPDKRPVAGRHREQPGLGLINALGGKGVLWAPLLARQWVNHLTEGVPFDAEVDVRRFGRPAG